MTVLFVSHTAAPSGAEIATARLARALRDLDVDITVAYTEDGPMARRMRADGFDTTILQGRFDSRSMTLADPRPHRLIAGGIRLIRLGWSLGAIAADRRATVLVAESTKALIMGAVATRRARIPLVWHVHDRISSEYFGPLLAAVVRGLGWGMSNGYIANSYSTLSSLIPRRHAVVAYPGVESNRNCCHAPQRDSHDTTVALVGRLTPWKGQEVFLRAVAETTVRPAHIYLVGGTFFDEEPYRRRLESLAVELGLPVTFTGHVDDPAAYMLDADILVHCSVLAEPFGQVVVEGMQAGCAVIASGPGGTTEIVEPGVNGLLVDAGDRRGLTSALNALICNRDLRCRLSAAAPRRAARFDVAESARAVVRLLDELGTPRASGVSTAWSRRGY